MSNIKIERDTKRWEVSVRAELPHETLERYFVEALKEAQRETKIDGFRPGNAPASEVLRTHGEEALLQKAAELAVREELPNILAKEGVQIIDTPRVTVEALLRGKPLVFLARASLFPHIKLSDYKKIGSAYSSKRTTADVSEEEYSQALAHLRRERARVTKVELGAAPEEAAEQAQKAEEKDLPELDDAFVKTLGYESLQKFSDSVRAHLKSEKERHELEKVRASILDGLVKESTISYPVVLKEYELDDMEARLRSDLERMQTPFDTYLSQIKKTRDDLRKEWDEAADKRAKIRLVLGEIARIENITADTDVVDKNLEHAQKMYPHVNSEALRTNITHALQNEAVLRFLEQK